MPGSRGNRESASGDRAEIETDASEKREKCLLGFGSDLSPWPYTRLLAFRKFWDIISSEKSIVY
jgi:hypothetical protein